MADYISDTGAVIQNLKDAGCNKEVIEAFMKVAEAGKRQKKFELMERT